MPPNAAPPVAVAHPIPAFLIHPDLQEAIDESISFGATIHPVTAADYPTLGRLHDRVFGPGALTRTAYRVREGLSHHSPHCRLARDHTGTIIAFIRFAPILIGGQRRGGGALMLGPLAVTPTHANQGHARRLIAEGLMSAAAAGVGLVILVGDLPYYGRIGFVPVPQGQITMPGPVDLNRMLAFELSAGRLNQARGAVTGDLAACR